MSSWSYFGLFLTYIYISGLESREYRCRDPSHWPRGTLYQQKLALTSSTSGSRSIGIVRSWTQATEFSFIYIFFHLRNTYLMNLLVILHVSLCNFYDTRTCWGTWIWEGVPLSLVSTTEELFGRKSSGSGIEIREYRCRDSSRWPHGTLFPQKLAITSPTSGGRSVGIVHSQTQATEFSF
jgi:hypothetical protein